MLNKVHVLFAALPHTVLSLTNCTELLCSFYFCDSFSDQPLVLTFISLIMVSIKQYSAITVPKSFTVEIVFKRLPAVGYQLSGNPIPYISMRLFM